MVAVALEEVVRRRGERTRRRPLQKAVDLLSRFVGLAELNYAKSIVPEARLAVAHAGDACAEVDLLAAEQDRGVVDGLELFFGFFFEVLSV